VQRATVQEVAKEVNRNRESKRIFIAKLRGVVSVWGHKGVGVRPRANGSDQASGIFVSRAGASLAF
jgi:butyrate kinase